MESDRLATPSEACREFARNVGGEQPERAWILTDYDTWERNPFYYGPSVPHPEYDAEDMLACEFQPAEAACDWPLPANEVPF